MAFAFNSPPARVTGVIYLLYFFTAIVAQALVTRGSVALGNDINLVAYAFYIALTLLFFELFKPVNRSQSFFAALFSLIGCTFGILAVFHHNPAHINPLLFFGGYCFMIGLLIVRSTFLPRVLGWLLILAGIGWYAFLFPRVAAHLAFFIEALGVLAEVALMFWLLVMGIDQQQWQKQSTSKSGRLSAVLQPPVS